MKKSVKENIFLMSPLAAVIIHFIAVVFFSIIDYMVSFANSTLPSGLQLYVVLIIQVLIFIIPFLSVIIPTIYNFKLYSDVEKERNPEATMFVNKRIKIYNFIGIAVYIIFWSVFVAVSKLDNTFLLFISAVIVGAIYVLATIFFEMKPDEKTEEEKNEKKKS